MGVALLAEGVDRNTVAVTLVSKTLSVALLAEGVDRNLPNSARMQKAFCRPPRGGRG